MVPLVMRVARLGLEQARPVPVRRSHDVGDDEDMKGREASTSVEVISSRPIEKPEREEALRVERERERDLSTLRLLLQPPALGRQKAL